MSQMRLIMSDKQVAKMRATLKAAFAITVLSLAVTGFRYAESRMRSADLAEQVRMQENTLKGLRDIVKNHPVGSRDTVKASRNSVAQLQSEIERAAAAAHCKVTEFQASPDRAPYISVFTLDTNRPTWEQVPIHVSLQGSIAATLATVQSFSKCGVPIEPDSIEISRQSISEQGSAEVTIRVDLRALIQGGKA